jgi:two-component system KDP operon response regulator KdpE
MTERVLVVEDEHGISNYISMALSSNGFEPLVARSGAEAYAMILSKSPDLVLLDLGLPDMDGLQILRSLREWTQLPIVVVSARMHERDKVEALDLGADDYITKPFGPSELLARVRTAIRHARHAKGHAPQSAGCLAFGDLVVDFDKHQVRVAGQNAHLTQNEFRIVSLLAQNAGRVLTYDYLMKEIWGPWMKSDNRILRVNMANIRRKIERNTAEPEHIFTEVGVGYRFRDME